MEVRIPLWDWGIEINLTRISEGRLAILGLFSISLPHLLLLMFCTFLSSSQESLALDKFLLTTNTPNYSYIGLRFYF